MIDYTWLMNFQRTTHRARSTNPRPARVRQFYLVEVGVQSPGGEKTRRTVLRRFSDFRVLAAKLKSELPSKRWGAVRCKLNPGLKAPGFKF